MSEKKIPLSEGRYPRDLCGECWVRHKPGENTCCPGWRTFTEDDERNAQASGFGAMLGEYRDDARRVDAGASGDVVPRLRSDAGDRCPACGADLLGIGCSSCRWVGEDIATHESEAEAPPALGMSTAEEAARDQEPLHPDPVIAEEVRRDMEEGRAIDRAGGIVEGWHKGKRGAIAIPERARLTDAQKDRRGALIDRDVDGPALTDDERAELAALERVATEQARADLAAGAPAPDGEGTPWNACPTCSHSVDIEDETHEGSDVRCCHCGAALVLATVDEATGTGELVTRAEYDADEGEPATENADTGAPSGDLLRAVEVERYPRHPGHNVHDEIRAASFLRAANCAKCGANVARWLDRASGRASCNGCGAEHVEAEPRHAPATGDAAELERLLPALPGAIQFAREAFRNDGAEGETVHLLATAAELLAAEREQLIAMRDGAYEGGAKLRARVAKLEAASRQSEQERACDLAVLDATGANLSRAEKRVNELEAERESGRRMDVAAMAMTLAAERAVLIYLARADEHASTLEHLHDRCGGEAAIAALRALQSTGVVVRTHGEDAAISSTYALARVAALETEAERIAGDVADKLEVSAEASRALAEDIETSVSELRRDRVVRIAGAPEGPSR